MIESNIIGKWTRFFFLYVAEWIALHWIEMFGGARRVVNEAIKHIFGRNVLVSDVWDIDVDVP